MKARDSIHKGNGTCQVELSYADICKIFTALKIADKLNKNFYQLFMEFVFLKTAYFRECQERSQAENEAKLSL